MYATTQAESWDEHDEFRSYRRLDHESVLPSLVDRLRSYDALRLELENNGGIDSLRALSAVMSDPVELPSYFGSPRTKAERLTLGSPGGINEALRGVSHCLILETRRHPVSRLPVFYLARTRADFRTNYDQVIEDHFKSEGYPLADPRYAQLTVYGRHRIHLRVSAFRDTLRAETDWEKDNVLHQIGHHVLSAAWHEDQMPVNALSELLHIPELREVVELLFLIQGVDLCELRSQLDKGELDFFVTGYRQPAIAALLAQLPSLSGERLSELPKLALKRYTSLSRQVGKILRTAVSLRGQNKALYQLLFANFTRVPALESTVLASSDIQAARLQLQKLACAVEQELLDNPS